MTKPRCGGGILQVKTVLSEEGNSVLNFLPLHYDYVVTDDGLAERNELQCLTVRCSLESITEVASWLEAFQYKSYTRWIVGRCTPEPTRFTFRRQWSCHHSCLNKGKTKSKSTNCLAKIDFKIKKLTCDTRKKDEFLRVLPPLPTIIKIYYQHNHTDEYVRKKEKVLQDFRQAQVEIKSELSRLQDLISKGKPGLSAMRQFLNQLKTIKTEQDLFESMRKVRLKPAVFPRVGRPPKNRSDNQVLRRTLHPQKQGLRHKKKGKTYNRSKTNRTATATATLIALDPNTVYINEDDHQTIEFHTLEEVVTEQPSGTIDISYLFTQ